MPVRNMFLVSMCLLLTLFGPHSVAKADDCTAQFASLEQSGESIAATITINQNNGTVSYAKFFNLIHHASITGPTGVPTGASFTDQSGQLFNDRDQTQPFPVSKSDKLGIVIAHKGNAVDVTYTLLSWNNGKMGFTATCDGGLMHGYANGAYYVISFQLSPPIQ